MIEYKKYVVLNEINLVLPSPPSINSYWLSGKLGSHKFLSPKARKFKNEVFDILKENNCFMKKMEGRLFYFAKYYAPDKRARDIDNFCTKGPIDALKDGGLFIDDDQIDYIQYQRENVIKNGKLEIKILEVKYI